MTLLDCFPLETPRTSQKEVLIAIETAFSKGYKNVLLDAPVGSGKSAIAVTIAKYYNQGHILTPRKALQDQYQHDFGKESLVTMKGRSSYPCTYCSEYDETYQGLVSKIKKGKIIFVPTGANSCKEGPCLTNGAAKVKCVQPGELGQPDQYPCPYHVAIDTAQNRDMIIHNLHSFIFQTYYAERFLKRNLLVVDECFPPEVEILTELGFIKFRDLPSNIQVAQYGEDGISFVKPIRYIEKDYSGDMIRLVSHKWCDLPTTANHEILIKHKNVLQKVLAKDFKPSPLTKLIVSNSSQVGTLHELTPYERFLIAMQADGSISYYKNNGEARVDFSFSKERKIIRFISIVSDANLEWDEVKGNTTQGNILARRRFTVKGIPNASKILSDHFNIGDVSPLRARAIIEEMVEWDGYKHSATSWYYSSTVEANVDFYQAISILAGHRTNKTIQVDNRKDTYSDVYRLFITLNTNVIDSQSITKQTYQYSGKVYCVTVPSGNIVVRNNNKVVITGNCHEMEGILRGFAEKKVVIPTFIKDEDAPSTDFTTLEQWVGYLTPFKDLFSLRSKSNELSPREEFEVLLLDLLDLSEVLGTKFVVDVQRDPVSKRSKFLFIPEYVGNLADKYILNFGEKRLLMSGTIYSKELYCRLNGLRVEDTCYIKIGSSFPVANRPIYAKPEYMVDTSHKTWDINFKQMIINIKKIMDTFHNAKGLIHAPSYHAALTLSNALKSTGRVIAHDKDNFSEVLSDFYASDKPLVLISPICQQGVDFKDDRARFQIILRVPYPSTSDPLMAKKVKEDFSYYNYRALVTFGQMIGRVNRSESDFGVTVLMDTRFNKFLESNKRLLPKWVMDAIIYK